MPGGILRTLIDTYRYLENHIDGCGYLWILMAVSLYILLQWDQWAYGRGIALIMALSCHAEFTHSILLQSS